VWPVAIQSRPRRALEVLAHVEDHPLGHQLDPEPFAEDAAGSLVLSRVLPQPVVEMQRKQPVAGADRGEAGEQPGRVGPARDHRHPAGAVADQAARANGAFQ